MTETSAATRVPSARRRPLRLLIWSVVLAAAAALAFWALNRDAAVPQNELAAAGTAPEADPEATLDAAQRRAAYSRVLPASQRVMFFAPFQSYAGVDELLPQLEAAGYVPDHQSRRQPVPDGVPPNDSDIVRVAGFKHLGVVGKLELQFFNNRLCQLEFEPEDAKTYREKFRAQWPDLRREQNGRSEQIRGALRIASSLDLAVSEVGQALQSRPFVLWQDRRLIRQRDSWDQDYAREAAR